jgi:hypothetical protein
MPLCAGFSGQFQRFSAKTTSSAMPARQPQHGRTVSQVPLVLSNGFLEDSGAVLQLARCIPDVRYWMCAGSLGRVRRGLETALGASGLGKSMVQCGQTGADGFSERHVPGIVGRHVVT